MGEKLSVQHQTGLSTTLSPLEKENLGSAESSIISQTDYVGNVIYEQGSAAKILFDGGYYSLVDNLCHYFTRDHLGSIRAMVNEMVLHSLLRYLPYRIFIMLMSMVKVPTPFRLGILIVENRL